MRNGRRLRYWWYSRRQIVCNDSDGEGVSSNMSTSVTALVEALAQAYDDHHDWSTRPCATCAEEVPS